MNPEVRADHLARAAVVFIDGRSGAGKTVLADALAAETGAQLLRLDDLYPGWDGLREGSRAVADSLKRGHYTRYDWITGGSGGLVWIDPRRPIVVEGCGAITARNLRAGRSFARSFANVRAVWAIWLECPEDVRKARALGRVIDGEAFRPHWERWAGQEDAHYARERPIALAHEIRHCQASR